VQAVDGRNPFQVYGWALMTITQPPSWPVHLSPMMSCTHARTHARMHACTRAHTHTHTHPQPQLPPHRTPSTAARTTCPPAPLCLRAASGASPRLKAWLPHSSPPTARPLLRRRLGVQLQLRRLQQVLLRWPRLLWVGGGGWRWRWW